VRNSIAVIYGMHSNLNHPTTEFEPY